MKTNDYFYCYSAKLKQQLLNGGARFICVGVNENTGRKFWLFEKNPLVQAVLTEWSETAPQ
jgi:hypothetical protein